MEFDWVGHCTCSFGSNFLGTASKFKIMSFRQKINLEYIVNIAKLPEKLSIDPRNSKTMKKLKLQLISKVNLMQAWHGSKCLVCSSWFSFSRTKLFLFVV